MNFKSIPIGATFDFVNPETPDANSFFDPCRKISARKYESLRTGITCPVGSINAKVFHVGDHDAKPAARDYEAEAKAAGWETWHKDGVLRSAGVRRWLEVPFGSFQWADNWREACTIGLLPHQKLPSKR